MVAYTVTGLKKMSSSKPDLAGEFSRGGINIVQVRVNDKHTDVYSPVNYTTESKVSGQTIKKEVSKLQLRPNNCVPQRRFFRFYLNSFETVS